MFKRLELYPMLGELSAHHHNAYYYSRSPRFGPHSFRAVQLLSSNPPETNWTSSLYEDDKHVENMYFWPPPT